MREDRLIKFNLFTGLIALVLGSVFGLLQGLARAPAIKLSIPFLSYYQSLTAHGVLQALVFTTFFIMGLLLFGVVRTLNTRLHSVTMGWAGYALMLAGTVSAAAAILAGKATVLYTFYAPLQAHPAFYVGATLLVVGSWVTSVEVFLTYRRWRRTNPGTRVPLVTHGAMATLILWFIATFGVAVLMLAMLIPWSLGLVQRVDPMLDRLLFWYFGHPLVYFWLLPAYVIWYTVMPKLAGGKLFSDPLARTTFIFLLLFSTPVGLHHEFMDPGISGVWKYLHTVTTFIVVLPSLVTAFTLTASLEHAGRARGGQGLLGWIGRLPWADPVFAPIVLSMILFALGGISGIVNASYNLNAVVHNTAWIVGHFHLTVGTAVALTFMGTCYWLLPALTGRPLRWPRLALTQAYLWTAGMIVFSGAMHLAGLLGSPRRTADITYFGSPVAASWIPHVNTAAVGGTIMFLSVALFVAVVLGTLLSGRRQTVEFPLAEALSGPENAPAVLDRWWLWVGIAVLLVVIAYAGPAIQLLSGEHFGSPGFKPW
ncbi:MAG: b(o/a)3-type cytochrome-c oxidase subunit 1 [Chloroflexi bacterium]|nr:b(o/a)3-type cytochrome-c oxidase subunit 1 [Chloroflexota bacterium]